MMIFDDAEARATTILLSVFGYETCLSIDGDILEALTAYVAKELVIVAAEGFSTFCAAPDCRDMTPEETTGELPGMITWEQLKAASEVKKVWVQEKE